MLAWLPSDSSSRKEVSRAQHQNGHHADLRLIPRESGHKQPNTSGGKGIKHGAQEIQHQTTPDRHPDQRMDHS